MANYITVDSGTTNTRVSLICNKTILATKKTSIGVGKRDITALKNAIKTAISELLSENCLREKDIERILASGMITSEYGLCNLPHITVPAGIEDLHNAMYETVIEDISKIPFVLIRGVKTESTDLDGADMMRGEETELMGILNNTEAETTYVLPGSHSKLICVDERGRIIGIRTMLTGEMVAALSEHTILRDAVNLSTSKLDEEYLLNGYEYCLAHGINETLFKVRVLKNVLSADEAEIYSFFVGAVLTGELQNIIKSNSKGIVISGQSSLSNAMYAILKKHCDKDITLVDPETVNNSTVLGALKIFLCHLNSII